MPLRRRAWLSREGWYYSFVLAFIVGGAVLRSINLLVILAGMMVAPLLLNWRLVMASLRGLAAGRRLPEQVTAGLPLTVEIGLANSRWSMSSWLVVVEDWIVRLDGDSPNRRTRWQQLRSLLWLDRTHAQALAAEVPAKSSTATIYRLALQQRGKYRFGPLRVSTRYPLGLVWGQFTVENYDELIVAPRLGRLTAEWTRLLAAEQAGDERRHPQRGIAAGDYYGLRPWQSGDSTRWIHWRSTAKLGAPTVLQFERQRNHDVALVLDPWLPPQPTEQDGGLLELAISLAATAVSDLTSRGHSRLTFAVAGQQPLCWSGPASPLFCHEVLGKLATLEPSDGRWLDRTLVQARDQAPRGARLIVVSPREPQLAADPENDLVWIDVSQSELTSLFVLE